MIDKQKAIAALEAYRGNSKGLFASTVAGCIKIIRDIPDDDGWIPVTERLPERSEDWKRYIVLVLRSHYPTSSYDLCDAPYDEEFVTTATYDSNQKIWHLDLDEQLNALIDIEDSPLNGDYITRWMPMPELPKEEK